ncbi:hypothetical protein RJ639_047298 [Escallonia herrerae]|uniref:RNA helicase n=1 Tax=Escallonia herrerae TaxID=1293975 RepID=A0AA88W4L9_9ASTE|nr:hypothetical protein RJ639_047298 [Escallonia herrerae]
MTSSPTSSSYSSPFASSPKFTGLPVTSLRDKIVEKIQENRVTLIVGETGCGKSSQVPQYLLEENMEPILCTQPRRFAVVAVARMVAKTRDCEVGGEIGYHIGHSRVFSARSKIIFKTAGVLLEEMREKGLNALKYKMPELLGMSSEQLALTYCSGPSPSWAVANMKPEVHKLIHGLVLHIHKNEPDIEKSILVFLPTYHALEKQWFFLKPFSSDFKVHILHSSIDTVQALNAMRIWKSHRKVILATNIAESSVTIPKVAYVIDSCRSLQVFWDSNRKAESAELVWVSKSQAEQRKGRTGRTCDGHTYRLVTGSFFSRLEDYEPPAILRLSLRQQRAMDPPDSEVVEDAFSLLVQIRALEKASPRGRYEPTFYGRLLASFSLSFDASVLIIKFGEMGMLREEYNDNYFSGDSKTTGLTRKEVALMANLSAFEFWQRVFKDKQRLERLKQLFKFDETKGTRISLPKTEEEWCSFHNLVQSSLHHIAEICMVLLVLLDQFLYLEYLVLSDEDILNSLHRFRPKFLVNSDGVPTYYDPYEFEHTCLLKYEQDEETSSFEHLDPCGEIRKCIALPFVDPAYFQMNEVAEKFATIIKEGCRNGELCSFSHDLVHQASSSVGSSKCQPEDEHADASLLLQLFPTPSDGCILLLDDTDFHFSSQLSRHYDPSSIISTTSLAASSVSYPLLTGIRILWGLSHPYQTIFSNAGEYAVPWEEVKCVLWFPRFDSYAENSEAQKVVAETFFEYLAIRMIADALCEVKVIMTMNNIRFSQMQVEKLGRDSFFFLKESFLFDETSFGALVDKVTSKKPMLASKSISYVFDFQPPTDIQFGDYATVIRQQLLKARYPITQPINVERTLLNLQARVGIVAYTEGCEYD